ncbi:hypothetical protein JCM10212_001762 [Sporobolomyces blumeae]
MTTATREEQLKAYLDTVPEFSTAKVQFYYSSLPLRKTANPTGYSSALSWWRKLLTNLTEKGLVGPDHLVLNVDEPLKDELRRDKIGRPSSLGVIVSEMAQASDLVPLDDYLTSPTPQGFSVLSLLSRPFWWGVSKVLGSSNDVGEQADETEWEKRKGLYVVPDLVEKTASSIVPLFASEHADRVSRLYTLKSFRTKFGSKCLPGIGLSERDCRVLVRYLSGEGHCVVDGDVIKFAPPLATPGSTALSISESDRSILTLQASLSTLSTYISTLEARIETEREHMVAYHAKKQLNMVKSHLIAKKQLEKVLDERVASRNKLQEVVLGIERAVGDEETLEALSLGSSTLRQILSSPTLQLSNIEATTSALDEQLVSAAEINDAVLSVSAADRTEIEDEVEAELRELVEADEREQERKKEEARKEQDGEIEKRLAGLAKVPKEPGENSRSDVEKGKEKVAAS